MTTRVNARCVGLLVIGLVLGFLPAAARADAVTAGFKTALTNCITKIQGGNANTYDYEPNCIIDIAHAQLEDSILALVTTANHHVSIHAAWTANMAQITTDLQDVLDNVFYKDAQNPGIGVTRDT
ncbi:MAG: hypothetical protein QG656_1049, partial [Candidatus Hydrogenedentes bacterium]|nr:hypothetical protein [Candidatus Hydrogenedentota bacterium]